MCVEHFIFLFYWMIFIFLAYFAEAKTTTEENNNNNKLYEIKKTNNK